MWFIITHLMCFLVLNNYRNQVLGYEVETNDITDIKSKDLIEDNVVYGPESTFTTFMPQINNNSRVNGGQVVTKVVPFQVSLQLYRRGKWQHFCGGSIITPNHVVTAAHCVDKTRIEDMSVVAGTLNWSSGGDRHKVAAKKYHPQFSISPIIINDIAVLKVTPPFNLFKPNIGTVDLGTTSRVGEKVAVRLTGWGSTTPTITVGLPEQLQMLFYNTISNSDCTNRGFRVTKSEVCALAIKGQGACVGDSGGPLVTTQTGVTQLVGIVSYGTATCAQGRPDVYTRVSSFLPYINRVITNDIP
ncbi:chymotrypsin-1-like [Teleopsis dalmanni]|uniref:chymotrypsin-1-like n=1 Tax=Teleopsis dalmanni TaxID=139649 RepID=UPI0018CF1FFE|nr:chymotrypsin-1-like [Teleopsis dalmanni]XP_037930574.1 chymotrypsin-1-like [Teleopsis dalmanni]XP_037946082.1 chymotrypsin-1-like [Teleopsis dalmanni]